MKTQGFPSAQPKETRQGEKSLDQQIVRLCDLVEMLRSNYLKGDSFKIKGAQLAGKWNCDLRTVQRLVKFAKDKLKLPIESSRETDNAGYYLTSSISSLGLIPFTNEDYRSLLFAVEAVRGLSMEHHVEGITRIHQKLRTMLQQETAVYAISHEHPFLFKIDGQSKADPALLHKLETAVCTNQKIEFLYQGYQDKAMLKRYAEPYRLLHHSGDWYVLAWDITKQAYRNFKPVRMQQVSVQEKFTPRDDFDEKMQMAKAFGIRTGETKETTVVIEFSDWAAKIVSERKWHGSEVIQDLGNGRIRYTVTLTSLFELERWVLSFGICAKVLEPRDFALQIKGILSQMADNYVDQI
ncbi:MAG: WYL domain-containing protein [Verrucomicrobiota bacterium]|nr:WYL domain-containing protein [Verrucomicrobiota bacterium]